MGRPLPGVALDVVDGELVLRPRAPTRRSSSTTSATQPHEGPWHTGDRVTRDEDGYLYFEGRTDDVIISAGYRIGPFEVESALVAHAAVAEAAVVAAPDDERGSVVRAVVVLRDGYAPSDALARELQDHVKAQTAPYKYPRDRRLRRRAAQDRLGQGPPRGAASVEQVAAARARPGSRSPAAAARRISSRSESASTSSASDALERRAGARRVEAARAAPAPRSAARARPAARRAARARRSGPALAVAVREAEAASSSGSCSCSSSASRSQSAKRSSSSGVRGAPAGSSSSQVIATAGGSGRGSSLAATPPPTPRSRRRCTRLAAPAEPLEHQRGQRAHLDRVARVGEHAEQPRSPRPRRARAQQAVQAVAERVPVGVPAQQRALALAVRAAAAGQRDRGAVDAAARAGSAGARSASRASASITRSRQLGWTQSTLIAITRRKWSASRSTRSTGACGSPLVGVPAQRGREVALGDRPGRRVEHRQQQLAVLAARARRRRSAIASRRLAQLGARRPRSASGRSRAATKRRIRSGVKCGCSTIAAPVPPHAARAARGGSSAARAWRNRISVFSSGAERGRVDLHGGRLREALAAALAVQPAQPGAQRRGPRRPDEPVRLVGRAQDAVELARPALGGVRAVLGRAERVVGDEQLRRCGRRAAPRPARAACTRAPPSPRSAARARASARSRSCPSPAGR